MFGYQKKEVPFKSIYRFWYIRAHINIYMIFFPFCYISVQLCLYFCSTLNKKKLSSCLNLCTCSAYSHIKVLTVSHLLIQLYLDYFYWFSKNRFKRIYTCWLKQYVCQFWKKSVAKVAVFQSLMRTIFCKKFFPFLIYTFSYPFV